MVSPVGPNGADSLIWSGCSKNALCVGYVNSSVVFGYWMLLFIAGVSVSTYWLRSSTPTTPCMLLYRCWQNKAKQHKNVKPIQANCPSTRTATSVTKEQTIIIVEREIEYNRKGKINKKEEKIKGQQWLWESKGEKTNTNNELKEEKRKRDKERKRITKIRKGKKKGTMG